MEKGFYRDQKSTPKRPSTQTASVVSSAVHEEFTAEMKH